MFGSKSAPVADVPVQVLLLDYLVEGYFLYPDIIMARDSDYWTLNEKMFTGMWLKSVRFQPTGNLQVSPQSVAKEFYLTGDNVVAAIPQGEPSIALAVKNNSAYRYPLKAEIYVGPYLIRGSVLGKGQNTGAFDHGSYFVREAEIISLLPNASWTGLKAPYLFVCGPHKNFIYLVG